MPANSSMSFTFHAAFLFPGSTMGFSLAFYSRFDYLPKPHQVYPELNLI